jgi:hypothetical protein
MYEDDLKIQIQDRLEYMWFYEVCNLSLHKHFEVLFCSVHYLVLHLYMTSNCLGLAPSAFYSCSMTITS